MPALNSLPAWPIERASFGSLAAPNISSRIARKIKSSVGPMLPTSSSVSLSELRCYFRPDDAYVVFVRDLERQRAEGQDHFFDSQLGDLAQSIDDLVHRPGHVVLSVRVP